MLVLGLASEHRRTKQFGKIVINVKLYKNALFQKKTAGSSTLFDIFIRFSRFFGKVKPIKNFSAFNTIKVARKKINVTRK